MVRKVKDEIPRYQQSKLLRIQAMYGTDPVLRKSYINILDPSISNAIESVLDPEVEIDEGKARWELLLKAQAYGLVKGNLITAEIVRAELLEFAASGLQ